MSALVPMIGTPAAARSRAKLERRLAAVLHDHAEGFFLVDDLEHVLQRQRLEVEAVGGVVIGGHRFRVAVDHDGLEAVLAQRHRRVHAAIVEFDPLPDAVRPAAEHDDFLPVGRLVPRTPLRTSSTCTRCASRTPRRSCPRACRPGGCPGCAVWRLTSFSLVLTSRPASGREKAFLFNIRKLSGRYPRTFCVVQRPSPGRRSA